MSGVMNWLLDLRTLRFGQEGVEFGFSRPLPPWAWALIVLAAVAMAWWTYRRLEGDVRWRGALAGVRALVLVLLAVLIAGPRLVKPNETEEKDWVLVLADRSASMGIKDVSGPAGDARVTREEQLREALQKSAPTWAQLAKDRVVVWMGFDGAAFELKGAERQQATGNRQQPAADPAALPVDLGTPGGRRTALGHALEQALRRAAARPVAGIVVLSDGRSIDEPSKGIVRRLQSEKIPVFTVPLGSPEAVADVAVRSAQGPQVAFVNDLVPVEAEIERIGAEADGSWGTVQLIDSATGLVLDQRDVGENTTPASAPGNDTQDSVTTGRTRVERVTLTARPGAAGAGKWIVKLLPRGVDLVAENNQTEIDLRLEDRPLRVIYFDGYPRWEQRYVKSLLVRERSITSASLLLSEGRRFVQEGDQTLISLPTSPEEWRKYDVIVIGDVRPDVFTEEQLAQLRDHVGINGAGVLWIGGESSTPGQWASTGLADLLPFSLRSAGPRGSGVDAIREPVLARPTPVAERYGMLRLTDTEQQGMTGALRWWPRELSDASVGWSRLRWAQRIERDALKPTTEILAEAVPEHLESSAGAGEGSETTPLVMSMRFGAGRILYVATDEIWRWRYGRGEDLPERFWLQMIRMLGRESLARSGQPARVEVTPPRAEINQPIRIAVELLDQRLVDAGAASITVRLTRQGERGEPPTPVGELILTPESAAGPRGSGSRTYSGTWVATESGAYRAEVADPLLAGERLAADIEVWLPEDELRRPETDHALLARLSEATGGRVLGLGDLDKLGNKAGASGEPGAGGAGGGLLPNRRLQLVGTPEEEALWDTPLALILLMSLLTAEWIGRRLVKLA